jgi:hypothetical protein
MGNNYYIDESEGDDICIEKYPHIGKFTFRNGNKCFIFYVSKDIQISRLQNMNANQTVIDECSIKKTVHEFLREIIEIPYIEQDFEFL